MLIYTVILFGGVGSFLGKVAYKEKRKDISFALGMLRLFLRLDKKNVLTYKERKK